jgi:signal peptidase I
MVEPRSLKPVEPPQDMTTSPDSVQREASRGPSGDERPATPTPSPVSIWRVLVCGRRPRNTLIRILVLVAVTFCLFKWVLFPVRITGISMEPTLHNGSIRIVNRLAYLYHPPQHGDIVSVGELGRPGMLMKRIIALPGETYAMRDGQLFINGQRYDEPYVVNRRPWNLPPFTLAADEYLVIGDNRGMNQQDHYFGRTERRYIVGRMLF